MKRGYTSAVVILADRESAQLALDPAPLQVDSFRRLKPRWRPAVYAAAAVPIAGMAVAIRSFGVNVPFWDDWALVSVLQKTGAGTLGMADLWAPHNEHRLVFPKLIMAGLASLTRWDLRAEMWLNFALACAGFLAVCWLMRLDLQPFGRRPWLALIAALLMFSAVQHENWTWGWEVQWYLEVLAAVLSLALLTRRAGRSLALAGAIGCAVVGTYTFGDGLLVWPLGAAAIAMLWRRRRAICLAVWLGCAAVAIGAYLYQLQSPPGELAYALHQPLSTAGYFLAYLGSWARGPAYAAVFLALPGMNWLGQDARLMGPTFAPVLSGVPAEVLWVVVGLPMVIGLIGFGAAVALHVQVLRKGPAVWAARLPALLLADLAILSGALTAVGRVQFGVQEALANRYTTISSLLWVALALLAWDALAGWLPRVPKLSVLLIAAAVATYASSYAGGVIQMQHRSVALREASLALHDLPREPDSAIAVLYPEPAVLRSSASILERLQLGPYAPRP